MIDPSVFSLPIRERLLQVKLIVFDVGETMIDETRQWSEWADFLGVPTFTLFAAIGLTIERGEHHRRALNLFRPDVPFDVLAAEYRRLKGPFLPTVGDLYPDVVPVFEGLASKGLKLAIAGNQHLETRNALCALGLPLSFVTTSTELGFEKPAREFFRALASKANMPVGDIAYVGDHFANDVVPSAAEGMLPLHLHRGPWALLKQAHEPSIPLIRISSLLQLLQLFHA